jgi:hypothetical protein
MEKQPFVPNQFFDIFARMVPGAVLAFAVRLLAGRDIQAPVVAFFVPKSLDDQVIPWLVVTIVFAYTLGHMLSPLVKVLDWLGKRAKPDWLLENETVRYNRLRFKYAATLTVATRIRAEYTMYGAIASALIVTELLVVRRLLWNLPPGPTNVTWEWHAATLVICAGMIYRYYDVHKRFCETIRGFEDEAAAHAIILEASDPKA